MSKKLDIQDPHRIRTLQRRVKFLVYAFLVTMCTALGIVISDIPLNPGYFILSIILLILVGLGIGYYIQDVENEINRRKSKPGPKIED